MMIITRSIAQRRRVARKCLGFTIAELLVVLLILAALGALVTPLLTSRQRQSKLTVTAASLRTIRRVIIDDYRSDMFERLPYPTDTSRQQHPQLHYLFVNPDDFASGPSTAWTFDPATQRGWSGPYLTESAPYIVNAARGFTTLYGVDGDQTPIDAWGNPIVLQQPVQAGASYSASSLQYARIVSAGPNGVLEMPPVVLQPTAAQQADDIVLYFRDQ